MVNIIIVVVIQMLRVLHHHDPFYTLIILSGLSWYTFAKYNKSVMCQVYVTFYTEKK